MNGSLVPTPKITAAVIGGAVATAVIGIAVWLGASEPPVGLEGAIAVLVGGAAGWLKK